MAFADQSSVPFPALRIGMVWAAGLAPPVALKTLTPPGQIVKIGCGRCINGKCHRMTMDGLPAAAIAMICAV
jgi:hypothetical protein